jgi:hypothetical protein
MRPILRFAITRNLSEQALARCHHSRVVDPLWWHSSNLRPQSGQARELIISIREIPKEILGRKYQSLEFMRLDVRRKPPFIDVILEGLLQSVAPRSGVMIASLRRPARKVNGQAMEMTEPCEPEVRASMTEDAGKGRGSQNCSPSAPQPQ